jgi:3-oxoacyl-[acyl-carrier protein] reductase
MMQQLDGQRRTEMLLEGKNAMIYGGGGSIGGAVARAFAREGAKVFLAGRTLAKLDEVAQDIRSAGGVAETAKVDALDEKAVEDFTQEVMTAVRTTFLTASAAARHMIRQRPGVASRHSAASGPSST